MYTVLGTGVSGLLSGVCLVAGGGFHCISLSAKKAKMKIMYDV
jgi:UDP-glucose 6-dehydrogenase